MLAHSKERNNEEIIAAEPEEYLVADFVLPRSDKQQIDETIASVLPGMRLVLQLNKWNKSALPHQAPECSKELAKGLSNQPQRRYSPGRVYNELNKEVIFSRLQ